MTTSNILLPGSVAWVRDNSVEYHEECGCPCRRKKAKGCNRGECECNRDAFVRGGIHLVASCLWRPLWDIQADGYYGEHR